MQAINALKIFGTLIVFLFVPTILGWGQNADRTNTSRLALEILAKNQMKLSDSSYVVELDSDVESVNCIVKETEEGLLLQTMRLNGGIVLDIGQDAQRFNKLEIEMQGTWGEQCQLAWSNDLEPFNGADWLQMPSISSKSAIEPGKRFSTHTFNLTPQIGWVGKINKVFFSPTQGPSDCVIKNIRFYWEDKKYPEQICYNGVYLDVLYGEQQPWSLKVPEQGVFETYMFMSRRSWNKEYEGSVRATVSIENEHFSKKSIFEKRLDPVTVDEHHEWQKVRCDLSEYAGQDVVIHLEVDNLGSMLGDYFFWGNPMVFSDVQSESNIPVVLISCDTLRADHLSCYGYERETSPHLDAWAKEEAVIFDNTISTVPWTLPSHITLMTGLHAKNHNTSASSNLSLEISPLPELLRRAGYLTVGFSGMSTFFWPERGYRGFDYYDIPKEEDFFRHIYQTSQNVEQWLADYSASNLFLFFHNYDIHAKTQELDVLLPYSPEDPAFNVFSQSVLIDQLFDQEFNGGKSGEGILQSYNDGSLELTAQHHQEITALYDDCIRMVDESIYELFNSLKRQGLYDNALIIVTADHGEELNDHGKYGHIKVYEENCRVPLLIKFPDNAYAGMHFKSQVELTDIFATVLDALGLPVMEDRDSMSLLKVLSGEEKPRDNVFIRRRVFYANRTNDLKLVKGEQEGNIEFELYALEDDPKEEIDLYGSDPTQEISLKQSMFEYYKDENSGWQLSFKIGGLSDYVVVSVDSDTSFTAAWRGEFGLNQYFQYEPDKEPLKVIVQNQNETIKILPEDVNSPINVRISSTKAMHIKLGLNEVLEERIIEKDLIPEGELFTQPEFEEDLNMPQCAIWFEEMKDRSDVLPESIEDEQTREILDSLGYL